MISDEKTKQNLLLAYKISKLYLKSGASTSSLSTVTEVPLATIKRSITTVGKRRKDYLRLLPELGSEQELIFLQEAIDQMSIENKKRNKWNSAVTNLEAYKDEIEEIKVMYKESNPLISEDTKMRVVNLRYSGSSMREIAKETGISLSTVSTIVTNVTKENKK